jgi:hypothetical protein
MKRFAAVVSFAVLYMALGSWAAEEQSSFTGTWIFDSKKSDKFVTMDGMPVPKGGGRPMPMDGPRMQPIGEQAPIVIEQTESEMHISSTVKSPDGKDIPIIENYKFDGNELVEMVPVPGSPNPVKRITKATLKKDTYQFSQKSSSPFGTTELKKEYILSKDGKTLTLLITNKSMFRTFQRLVYHKQ